MKHVKTYESFIPFGSNKYNDGDYIRVKNTFLIRYEILKIIGTITKTNILFGKSHVKYITKNADGKKIEIDIEDIEDLATSQEIKDFKLRKSAKKYNL